MSRVLPAYGRHNQIAIQPHFKLRIFIELDVVPAKQQARSTTKACAGSSADGCAFSTTQHSSTGRTHTGANRDVGDHALFVRTLSAELAFVLGGLNGMVARNTGDCGDQWNPAMTGLNLVKGQLHSCSSEASLKAANVAFDCPTFRNKQSARCYQVLPQFSLEVFALRVHFAGVQTVFEFNDETAALRNCIWRSPISLSSGACLSSRAVNRLRRANRVRGTGFAVTGARCKHRAVLVVRAAVVLGDSAQTKRQHQGTNEDGPRWLHGDLPQN